MSARSKQEAVGDVVGVRAAVGKQVGCFEDRSDGAAGNGAPGVV
jgi:hypothetical protein